MLVSYYKNRINIHILIELMELIDVKKCIHYKMHSYALTVNVQGTKSMNKITNPFTSKALPPPFRDSPFTLILVCVPLLRIDSTFPTFIYITGN